MCVIFLHFLARVLAAKGNGKWKLSRTQQPTVYYINSAHTLWSQFQMSLIILVSYSQVNGLGQRQLGYCRCTYLWWWSRNFFFFSWSSLVNLCPLLDSPWESLSKVAEPVAPDQLLGELYQALCTGRDWSSQIRSRTHWRDYISYLAWEHQKIYQSGVGNDLDCTFSICCHHNPPPLKCKENKWNKSSQMT